MTHTNGQAKPFLDFDVRVKVNPQSTSHSVNEGIFINRIAYAVKQRAHAFRNKLREDYEDGVLEAETLPATAPANGEEWEEKIGIKYFTTWGTLRRFAKAEDLLKDIRTLLKNRGDEICAECVLVVERAKELERERAVGIIKRVQKEVEEYPFKGFVGKIKRTEKLLQEALASIAEGEKA